MAEAQLERGAETTAAPWLRHLRFLGHSRYRDLYLLLVDSLGHLNDDDGWAMASHVALSALMSIFPFLIFVAALAGFVGDAQLAGNLADLLFATWPRIVAVPITTEVHRVVMGTSVGLLTVSALISIYLASNGVGAIRTALNRAYRVVEHRSFVVRQVQNLLFVVIGAVTGLTLAFLGLLGPLIFAELTGWLPRLAQFEGNLFPSAIWRDRDPCCSCPGGRTFLASRPSAARSQALARHHHHAGPLGRGGRDFCCLS